jgi:DNA-binding NtrC family response regulator
MNADSPPVTTSLGFDIGDMANRAAGTDSPIMLTGESGTGKELFAHAIHAASARREKPFVAVTCRAPAEDALEAELLGRESGAFGDETASELGAFQLAHGGTLLLHDIGSLPMGLQLKLIDALRDDHESTGKNRARTDVRLICTTSGDLKQLIAAGKFREDLYYRINVLSIEVLPLGGNITKSARLAKRHRSDFHKLLSRYRVLAEDFKPTPHR